MALTSHSYRLALICEGGTPRNPPERGCGVAAPSTGFAADATAGLLAGRGFLGSLALLPTTGEFRKHEEPQARGPLRAS